MPIYDAEWQEPFKVGDLVSIQFEDVTYFLNGEKGFIESFFQDHYAMVRLNNAPNRLMQFPLSALRHVPGYKDNPIYGQEWLPSSGPPKVGEYAVVCEDMFSDDPGELGLVIAIKEDTYFVRMQDGSVVDCQLRWDNSLSIL